MDQEETACCPPFEKAPDSKTIRHRDTILFSMIGIVSSMRGPDMLELLQHSKLLMDTCQHCSLYTRRQPETL
jgi:hypothetical protein